MDIEQAELAQRACGDIPPGFCHVVGVEVRGDHATVWLLTGGPQDFAEYEEEFVRVDGAWEDGAGHGGFQTGTPAYVRPKADQMKNRLRATARPEDVHPT